MSRRRFIFQHWPRTGGNSITSAAESSGLSWERAWKGTETLDEFMLEHADLDWLTSHFLFRNYEPADDEVYFSWIRDPVDMFFSGFKYWRIVPVRGDEFGRTMAEFMRKVEVFEDARAYTDHVLANKPAGVFPRGLYDGFDWSKCDFVGVTERMGPSLEAFNAKYGTALPYTHINASNNVRFRYRRDELEELFAPELELFLDHNRRI